MRIKVINTEDLKQNMIKIPFTDDQVASLNGFQQAGFVHPFTCGNDKCRNDLIATVDGWKCPSAGCNYTQDWAHAIMADWSWKKPLDQIKEFLDQSRKDKETEN